MPIYLKNVHEIKTLLEEIKKKFNEHQSSYSLRYELNEYSADSDKICKVKLQFIPLITIDKLNIHLVKIIII